MRFNFCRSFLVKNHQDAKQGLTLKGVASPARSYHTIKTSSCSGALSCRILSCETTAHELGTECSELIEVDEWESKSNEDVWWWKETNTTQLLFRIYVFIELHPGFDYWLVSIRSCWCVYKLEEGTETKDNGRRLCTVGIWQYPCAI